jgi:hypothetical protein
MAAVKKANRRGYYAKLRNMALRFDEEGLSKHGLADVSPHGEAFLDFSDKRVQRAAADLIERFLKTVK